MKIAVIGLGPVGLSLLAASIKSGHDVIGIDLDQKVIDKHQRKILGEESDINFKEYSMLRYNKEKLTLTNTYNKEQLNDIEVFFICVNTDAVVAAIEYLNDFKAVDATIIIESTVYPAMIPLIEKTIPKKKLIISPERIMEGKLLRNLYDYVKIVGTNGKAAFLEAKRIYTAIGLAPEKLHRCTPEEAAMSKIVENAYRYWTIRFGHIVADIVQKTPNCNYENIREAVNTRPDRELPYSGLGIGGPCLYENMNYLIQQGMEVGAQFSDLESQMGFEHHRMLQRIPDKINNALDNVERCLLILGAAYRPDGQSILNSPILNVVNVLRQKHRKIFIYDDAVEDGLNIVTDLDDVKNQPIDVIILAMDSEHIYETFYGLMVSYPEKIYINLTQRDILTAKNIKYTWIPC